MKKYSKFQGTKWNIEVNCEQIQPVCLPWSEMISMVFHWVIIVTGGITESLNVPKSIPLASILHETRLSFERILDSPEETVLTHKKIKNIRWHGIYALGVAKRQSQKPHSLMFLFPWYFAT